MVKLLIVDDEPVIRKGILQLIPFETLGIGDVYEAANGLDALAIVKAQHPHIVLADINMPEMDGLTLAKAIKAFDRKIQVAIITGYDYFEYAMQALKAGVDDFVLKPLSKKDVQALLVKLVSRAKEETAQEQAFLSLGHIQAMENAPQKAALQYKDQITALLNEHLSNTDFSLGLLAEGMNLTSGYLSSLFKDLFGIPFQDYLMRMRLERAKILLLTTAAKVYEIAEQSGFEDPNYFSTRFKKQFGITANQFRDNPGG